MSMRDGLGDETEGRGGGGGRAVRKGRPACSCCRAAASRLPVAAIRSPTVAALTSGSSDCTTSAALCRNSGAVAVGDFNFDNKNLRYEQLLNDSW